MAYLILKAQADALQRNLEEVSRVVEQFDWRDPRQVLALATQYEVQDFGPLKNALAAMRTAIQSIDPDGLFDALNTLEEQVTTLERRLRRTQAAHFEQLALRSPPLMSDFATTLNDELIEKIVQTKIEQLKQLQTDIAALESEGESAVALEAARTAWADYSTQILPDTPKVFSEYVELLGGLALRYTGFDHGICRLADELIHNMGHLPKFTWSSLTLPAGREMTYMIGLGFPEWTIWAVPLGAHAWGLGFIGSHPRTLEFIGAEADPQRADEMRVCLADVFATYVMGPAYACGVILLRLDAFTAFDGDEPQLAAKRARAVLYTLKGLNALDNDGFATLLIEQLEKEWNEALRQAGHGAPVDAPERDGGLRTEDVERIKRAVKLMTSSLGASRAYKGSRWPTVVDWAEKLANDDAEAIEVDADDDALKDVLRDLLNAAWKCRQELNPDLDRIDREAKSLWSRLVAGEAAEPKQETKHDLLARTRNLMMQGAKPDHRDGQRRAP